MERYITVNLASNADVLHGTLNLIITHRFLAVNREQQRNLPKSATHVQGRGTIKDHGFCLLSKQILTFFSSSRSLFRKLAVVCLKTKCL